ncbi:MAG: hypothetical protein AMS22_06060 [Thiotrichales bacterium SG8_50]|nr:MAG: hypothetical protein AMS22_06060 [Thiotrichales bacterium SG8_50]KPL27125.1 MAG: hypothetical protein AMJ72_10610 [Acidithiobacillales bacterium SM1_46]
MIRIFRIFVCCILISPCASAADSSTALSKYLRPAAITQLDWLLLRAQVNSFAAPLRWDEKGLIMSIDLYVAGGGRVGITFVVNRERYVALTDDVVTKIFSNAVHQASNILVHTIPEVKDGANVYANFVLLSGGIVAEYQYGTLTLRKS